MGISKAILEDLGYSVETCLNGREAVDFYRENHLRTDCVIIDLMMPDLSGYECFKELKKINPAVRAVISTGYGRNSEVEAALNNGVRDFIQKPFESARLSQVLSAILTA